MNEESGCVNKKIKKKSVQRKGMGKAGVEEIKNSQVRMWQRKWLWAVKDRARNVAKARKEA